MGVLLPDYQVTGNQTRVIVVRHSFRFDFRHVTWDDFPQVGNIWLYNTTNKVEYDISKLFLNEKMKEILIYVFYIFHEICLPAYN